MKVENLVPARAGRAKLGLSLLMALSMMSSTPVWAESLPDFESLVNEQSASVLSISVTRRDAAATPQMAPGMPPGAEMPEALRRFFEMIPQQPTPQPREGSAIGSGFVLSEDGYLLTNAHVVEGAREIEVKLHDRRTVTAQVVGTDRRTDIALLRIDAEGLVPVELGDSDQLRVGQWVLAIGAPFGLDYTATQGIVSALSRSLPDDNYVPFIQTDVAVNPGNSGGPLFDTEGRVVGINSQIYSRTGGYMGLSFSIPINLAVEIADQLKSDGHVSRGWLGVSIQDMDQDLAESFSLERPKGALIADVQADSPASRSELKTGDVILEFNGKTVNRSAALPPMVGRVRVGETVPVTILRNGEEMDITVTVGGLEDETVAAAKPAVPKAKLGASVAALSSEQKAEIGEDRGVQIQETAPDGPAARAGLQANDILLTFDGKDVESPEQLSELVEASPRDRAVATLFVRNGQPRFVGITIPDDEPESESDAG